MTLYPINLYVQKANPVPAKKINEAVSIIKNVSSFRPHMNLFRIFAWTSPFFDVQEDYLL